MRRGGRKSRDHIYVIKDTDECNVCVRRHTHTHCIAVFEDSRLMTCNYFLNGRPFYQNVNVYIITGSATPVRMSWLSARQSHLRIEWQISMRRCRAK